MPSKNKMNRNILVSIVTPTLNHGQFLEEAILSVKNQDYPNIEHIVVDGGSTDNTLEILKKYESSCKLRWISEPDEGEGDALNKGFRMAKGEIIGWLNSDNVLFTKDVVSYIVKVFERYPDVDLVYGDDAFINKNNTIFAIRKLFNWNYNKLLRGISISPITFFRRRVILHNPPRKDLHFSLDLEYWLRLGLNYKFLYVRKIIAGNRILPRAKRMLAGKRAKIEDRKVISMYGGKFDFKYYLLHYFYDLPSIQFKKFLGIKDLMALQKNSNKLAFKAKFSNTPSLIFTQVSPKVLLMLTGKI